MMSFLVSKLTQTIITNGIYQLSPIIPALIPVIINLWVTLVDQESVSSQLWHKEYDYIVIGGGAAGSVIANRLAHENDFRVLLLEAGGNENFLNDIPALSALLQQSEMDWGFVTEPQKNACLGFNNRQNRWPSGKVIGGSSVLNDMLYFNGNPKDFDAWETLGAKGWSWNDVSKYFPVKQTENKVSKPTGLPSDDQDLENVLTVPTSSKPLTRAFLKSGRKLNYKTIKLNTESKVGFSVPQFTINKGRRSSAAKVYLEPIKELKNLKVVKYAFVKKIIIKNNVAVGVEFDRLGKTHLVRAKKEVILSAGVINSPKILMLSGIGPEEHLKSLGIRVVKSLPVGKNLRDHYGTSLSFTTNPNTVFKPERDAMFSQVLRYLLFTEGVLSQSHIDAIAFLNTKNFSSSLPNVQLLLQPFSIASDNGLFRKNVLGISDDVWNQYYKHYTNKDTFSIVAHLLHPKSRGTVELRSANPYDKPKIEMNYFSNQEDINELIDALKIAINISKSEFFKELNVNLFFDKLPGCKEFLMQSDKYLECLSRTLTLSANNGCGTCRMGSPAKPSSVVDSKLKVIGIQHLRVADASIMPTTISANTYAASVMIGEKAADMIVKQETEFDLEVIGHGYDIIINLVMMTMDIIGKLSAWFYGDIAWSEMYTMS